MRCFRPRCSAVVDLEVDAAAVARTGTEESSAAGREEACAMTGRIAGIQSLVRWVGAPGRIVVEGNCRAGCGVCPYCRDRCRGRYPRHAGRAWSVNRSRCHTPVLYSRVNPRTTKFHCLRGWWRGQLAELINVFLEWTRIVGRS